ncbi:DUF4123 domain-containing protein [Photobacterium damselae]|uniref:DUF4123 domain-containing protein n=1 Tax=Photobacterium damselae TaxID=38293 RepID=UPI0025430E91
MFNLPCSLQEDESLYLMIDGSSITDIGRKIYELDENVEAYVLYGNSDYELLLDASPWLVKCTQQTEAILQWLEESSFLSTASWLFQSKSPINTIIEHFQSLIVADAYGQDVFFRFADPRVMFALVKEHIEKQNFHITAMLSVFWFKPEQHWICIETQEQRSSNLNKYIISDGDIEIFQRVAKEWVIKQLEQHITNYYPDWDVINPKIGSQQIVNEAARLGITTERGVYLYTYILGTIGIRNIQENKYPQIFELLQLPSQYTPEQRVEKAAMMVQQENKELKL